MSTSDCPTFAKKRCIVREAKFEELEKACYTWFMQQRSKGAPVSGSLLEKALQLFPSIYPESSAQSFVASSGWLSNFISRHGIRGISLQEESLSADTSAVDSFQSKLHQMPGLTHKCFLYHTCIHFYALCTCDQCFYIAMYLNKFRLMGNFKVAGTPWSHTARITEVPL